MGDNLRSVFDIQDFSNVGFHFSDSNEKINSIINKGLLPLIGDNSATFEATPKISFSLGLDGLFQTANRFLNLAQTVPMSFFVNDTHIQYLPDSCKEKGMGYVMTTIEALEFMKNYFQNSSYFVFDAPMTEYSNPITDERLDLANDAVKNYNEVPIINDDGDVIDVNYDEYHQKYNINVRKPQAEEPKQKLYDLIRKLQECIEQYNSKGKNNLSPLQAKEYEFLCSAKNRLTIQLMDRTHGFMELGDVTQEGLFDQISFHEDKLKWRNQLERPLNVQSRVEIADGRAVGKGVNPEDLYILFIDGNDRANNLQILEALSNSEQLHMRSLSEDFDLVGLLLEYSKIPNGQLNEYISSNPEFGSKIMQAQEHARSVISKQTDYQEESTKTQVTMPTMIILPDTAVYTELTSSNKSDLER